LIIERDKEQSRPSWGELKMEASFIFFPRENNIFFLTENSDPEEA